MVKAGSGYVRFRDEQLMNNSVWQFPVQSQLNFMKGSKPNRNSSSMFDQENSANLLPYVGKVWSCSSVSPVTVR